MLWAEQFGLFTYEESTSVDTTGYDLELVSVAEIGALEDQGDSLVIVALVGESLHLRIFDAEGERIADEPENESDKWQLLRAVKEVMVANPAANASDTGIAEDEIVRVASQIALRVI